jgi:hypothetical protein
MQALAAFFFLGLSLSLRVLRMKPIPVEGLSASVAELDRRRLAEVGGVYIDREV